MKIRDYFKYSWFSDLAYVRWGDPGVLIGSESDPDPRILSADGASSIPAALGRRAFEEYSNFFLLCFGGSNQMKKAQICRVGTTKSASLTFVETTCSSRGLGYPRTGIAMTRQVARRAFLAMMQMTKIDVAAIEAARRG